MASHIGDIMDIFESITTSHNSLTGVMDDIKDDIKETLSNIHSELHILKSEMKVLTRVINDPTMSAHEVRKAKIPKPKAFGGVRDAKEVDNFLFDTKLYFDATKCSSNENKLKMLNYDGELKLRRQVTNLKRN